MPYTPFYPGGWQNQPAITTPIVAAALQNIENALISGNAGTFNILTYGADPTGATDSTTAIQNAINALPATGGIVSFPAGTYKVSSTLTSTTVPTYFLGAGQDCTIINYAGSGDCIRYYSTQSYVHGWGGGIKGLVIDGTSAAAGAVGAHIGDIYQLESNFAVRKFQGAGSKGIWFDNNYYWTEQMTGKVWAEQCASHIVFDNSANISGSATGSFDRAVLDMFFDMKGTGNGVIWQNGANCYDGRIGIYGNTDYGASLFYVLSLLDNPSYSFTATNASPCVFTAPGSYYPSSISTPVILSGGSLPTGFTAGTTYYVTSPSGATFELAATPGGAALNSTSTGSGTVKSSSYPRIANSVLDIGVECNGTTGTQPGTINFANPAILSTCITQCTGIIDFSADNPFALNSTNWSSNFQFDGPAYGDANLKGSGPIGHSPYNVGAIVTGGAIETRYNATIRVNPASNVTAIIMTSDVTLGYLETTIINESAFTLTFDIPSVSRVADGTSDVIAANTAARFVWDAANSLWYRTI